MEVSWFNYLHGCFQIMVCEIYFPKMFLYLRKTTTKKKKEPLIQIPSLFISLVKNFDSSLSPSTLKSGIETNDICVKNQEKDADL